MGCLVEFILEVFGRFILDGYFYLMNLVLPKSGLSITIRLKLEKIVDIYSIALLLLTVVGLLMLIPLFPPLVATIGKYILFVCLGLYGAHILFGIVLKIVVSTRKM